jgi:transcriptional regulator with XRE-family HTH domain
MSRTIQLTPGEAVRTLRERAGLSLADIAQTTRLSIGLLSLLENGKRSLPLKTMKKIDRALVKALRDMQLREQRIRKVTESMPVAGLESSSAQFIAMTVGRVQ